MRSISITGFLICVCLCSSVANLSAADWVHWRGPYQNGASDEKHLPEKWTDDPAGPDSNLIWKAPYNCRSSPLVMDGRVFIINDEGDGVLEGERVMAFDAATGKVLWEHKFNVFHSDIVSSRVGWANLAGDPATGYVYAHGVQGMFMCYEGATGRIVWTRSLTEEYGRVSGYGGRTTTPTIDGDLVIVGFVNNSWGDQALRGGNRFVAFNKRTGEPVWWSDPCDRVKVTYCSCPVTATINGQRLFITGAADGSLIALQAQTGVRVWRYPLGDLALDASPVVDGNLVYMTNSQENIDVADQGRVVCVDASQIKDGQPKLVWDVAGIKACLSSPMLHDGRLYVADDGAMLYCMDAKTGARIWKYKYGTQSRGAPVWADGKIYLTAVNARFLILKDEGKRCRELHLHKFFSKTGNELVECNSSPAISNGRIYFGTRDEFYCLGLKDWKADAPAAAKTTEEPKSAGPPALVQVVPADVVLTPGGQASFKVRLFDANGNFVKNSPAEWSLGAAAPPPTLKTKPAALAGTIQDGKLTVSKDVAGQQGVVVAKVGNLTGTARVRVAPVLPFKLNIAAMPLGDYPGGWLNTQGKFMVVERDGRKVLQKGATNPVPPIARANGYISMWNASNYTIQADLSGDLVGTNMPDVGIVNQRYTLQLNGNKQELRLLSWDALPRVDKSVPFKWEPGVWYTAKFTTERKGDKLLVRGKVWPRDQTEPEAWTIEFEDPRPNLEGSPGIYGYATGILDGKAGAPAYYDNITVTPNK